jgi:hypothetical protein
MMTESSCSSEDRPFCNCSEMLRGNRDSIGFGAQGESHPGVRLQDSVYGVEGGVGIAMRKTGLRDGPASAFFSPSAAVYASRRLDGVLNTAGLFSSRMGEDSPVAPLNNSDGGSTGRWRVNGNQRCSPPGGPPREV